jgi:hypothetical protein
MNSMIAQPTNCNSRITLNSREQNIEAPQTLARAMTKDLNILDPIEYLRSLDDGREAISGKGWRPTTVL